MSKKVAEPEENFDFLFKIVLIGDANVGKTCIVQRFKYGTFVEKHSSTIGVDFTLKTIEIDGKYICNNFSFSVVHKILLLIRKTDQATDLGHSWSGEIPHHNPKLLPFRPRSNPNL